MFEYTYFDAEHAIFVHDQIIINSGGILGIINQGLINVISEELRLGKNLKWPALWNSLAIRFSGTAKEKFDDYVPPYKNLGAIFITAFNTYMQQETE